MGRIHVLDDALVDQIAAGEVVERPASIARELLDNAVDAGATRIIVEIGGGGLELVRVTDDGEGMDPDDAVLALRRHATSKLHAIENLETIGTLGFRGEALPSIASVARLVITTRTRAASGGTRVSLDGGGAPTITEIGCAPGTSVEVRDLFYNVPARRKFLRAAATESAHIAEVVVRTALAHPALHLELRRDGRAARTYLPTSDLASRTSAVLELATLAHLEGTRDGVHVEALLDAPERARSGTTGLHTFVNRRPVRERTLARAVAFAYGSVLPPGRFPSGVVHITLDPREVDVNVHPQKAEVRFARGRAVLDAITRILAQGLGTSAWGGPAARGQGFWAARVGTTGSERSSEPTVTLADLLAVPQVTSRGSDGDSTTPRAYEDARDERTPCVADASTQPSAPSPGEGDDGWRMRAALRPLPTPPELPELPTRGPFGTLRVLAQVRRMLLVCEGPDALHVIDQHAADERVQFQRLRRAHAAHEVMVQRLLFPERIEVSPRDAVLIEESRDEILALGLDVTLLGATTAAVHAVPAMLRRATPTRLVRDLVEQLEHSGGRGFGDAVDMAIATMACHGAIRAGDPLSNEEAQALLRSLDEVDDFAGHCPHGRPIVFSVPFSELERRLGR